MPIPRLRLDRTALLVIDLQERLLPTIHQGETVAHHCGIMLDLARELGLRSIVTEQYVKGLGHSVASISSRCTAGVTVVEKTRFSGVVPDVLAVLDRDLVGTILVCGVEAHVCVLQTTLDLLAGGRQVFLLTDAISSGATDQIPPAFERMRAAGAIPTGVLGATYELLADAAEPRFKACLGHVKGLRPFESVR